MAAKVFFLLQALLQAAWSQCVPGCGGFIPAASTGGNFVVTSSSPVAPTGISVVSESVYEGPLCIEGNLPLLGSVSLEGALGTAGAGAVSYGCGDGVGIVAEEGPIVTGIAQDGIGHGGLGLGYGAYGLGGFGNHGCGVRIYGHGYGHGLYGFDNGLWGYGHGLHGFGGLGALLGGSGYGLGIY